MKNLSLFLIAAACGMLLFAQETQARPRGVVAVGPRGGFIAGRRGFGGFVAPGFGAGIGFGAGLGYGAGFGAYGAGLGYGAGFGACGAGNPFLGSAGFGYGSAGFGAPLAAPCPAGASLSLQFGY